MAYLRKNRINGRTYIYIMKSVRRGKKVSGKVLEYLGRNPEPKRLARACRYWGVKPKGRKAKTKGGR